MRDFVAASLGIVFGAVSLAAPKADASVIYDSGGVFNASSGLPGQDGWVENNGSSFVDGSPEFERQLSINPISASGMVTVGLNIATATDISSLDIEGSAFFDNYFVETFIPEPASGMIICTMGAALLGARGNRRHANC